MTEPLQQRKHADLLAIAGATLAGVALGALAARYVRPLGWYLLSGGLLVHATGMTARHRLDRAGGDLPKVWTLLYIGCWAVIVAVLGAALIKWFAIDPS